MKTIKSPRKRLSLLAAMLVAVVGIFGLASCETYDLDERMPSQLGSSIYDYLRENGFETYVKLIDDTTLVEGGQSYHDILSKTGSKTLFVADENAVKAFYKSGVFRKADGDSVRCYEDLSVAQKKMLLFGAMLDNVYQSANLSSRENQDGGDPKQGDCMRRVSLLTEIYDSVTFISPEDMPKNAYWEDLRNTGGVWCMTDATKRPKVIFTPKFLSTQKITDDDYNFLFHHNDGKTRRADEVSVNGVAMREGMDNQRCMNGFVHIMDSVVYPLPNMAEMLGKMDNTLIYNAIVNRFCAPYIEFPSAAYDLERGLTPTEKFNELYRSIYGSSWVDVDRIYQKRFFSVRSQEGDSLYTTSNEKDIVKDILLKYDIGWNSYVKESDGGDNMALQDMGVMIVPNDKAMIQWWNGSPLKERYGNPGKGEVTTPDEAIEDMAGVPDNVIKELVNNGLLISLVNSVPSKFDDVMNDAMDPMDIKKTDVVDVKICCNGALYITDKIFSPTTYKSVAFPALVNKGLEVINWAIDQLHFRPYLNSMVSTYSFFIPEGGKEVDGVSNCLVYTSPIINSVAAKYNEVYVFHYDEKKKTVTARKYLADKNGEPDITQQISSDVPGAEIENVLNDLLNYHIVIGSVEGTKDNNYKYGTESEYSYFKTKGGGMIKFRLNGNTREAWGGYQLVSNFAPSTVTRVYNQIDDASGNGRSYLIDKPLYTSPMTVDDVLTNNEVYPEFELFGNLLESSRLLTPEGTPYGGSNITVFNTYNYTVYAPCNDALRELIADKKIIYGDDLETLRKYYDATALINNYKSQHEGDTIGYEKYYLNLGIKLHQKMLGVDEDTAPTHADSIYTPDSYIADLETELDNFIKYHIQDNSIYVSSDYSEKGLVKYETSYINSSNGVFCKLAVDKDETGTIRIHDFDRDDKELPTVHKVVKSGNYYNIMCREYEYKTDAVGIYTSSYAVVHLLDSALDYDKVSEFGYADRSLYFLIR